MALTDKLKAIADAIRSKTGSSDAMTLDEMPEKIAAIETGSSPTAPYVEETYDESGELTAVRMVGHSKVRAGMFSSMTELLKVELPSTLTTIEDRAFNSCSNLKELNLPDNITSIGASAFSGCMLAKITHLPDKLRVINNNAFVLCSCARITELPSTIESIGSYAFSEGVYGDICFGSHLKSLGEYAFSYCSGITSLRFETPEDLPMITSTAFEGCGGILRIDVPWNEGDVPGAPWGAINATINYNYKE